MIVLMIIVALIVMIIVIVIMVFRCIVSRMIPVSVNKNTPPDWKTDGEASFEITESGAGGQFPTLDCKAKAHVKGTCFSQTPVFTVPQRGIQRKRSPQSDSKVVFQ